MNNIEVAYILLRFPYLTETFVAEEIQKIQTSGVKVHLFSLLSPRKGLVHPVSEKLVAQAIYVPSLLSPRLWIAQVYFILTKPKRYINLLRILLKQPAPNYTILIKRTVIFFKSIWIAKQIQYSSIQLIHTHFAWLSAAGSMIVSELLDIPFTLTAHAYDIYSQKSDLLELTTSKSDRVITISEYNKREILDRCRTLNVEDIEVIHCGVDVEQFQAAKRQHQNLKVKITSVGSLTEKKGHAYLIEACKKLDSQGLDFHCEIIGEGNLHESLQDLIGSLHLEDQVSLAGSLSQNDVRQRLSNSDLFVLACVETNKGGRDGIPVAMMEALAMEVPVVSTNVSGIPELIKHESTGLLVRDKDVDGLVFMINQVVHNNKLRVRLQRNGRKLVNDQFNIEENAKDLANSFHKVIISGKL